MSLVVINDPFWGDCGKGLAVARFAPEADVVVRYNGGCNAGHSVPYNGSELNYHHIPSALHLDKICIMANGMVIYPSKFFTEIEDLRKVEPSIKTDNLYLSNHAHVTMPYHIIIEGLEELHSSIVNGGNIGTTGNGIGTTYADKYGRHYAVRVEDLLDKNRLARKMVSLVPVKQGVIDSYKMLIMSEMKERGIGLDPQKDRRAIEILESPALDADEIIETYASYGKAIDRVLTVMDTSPLLNSYIRQGKNILCEGAQGTMLDPDHCNDYPNNTSSTTISGGVFSGAGINYKTLSKVIGALKVYCSRVGSGEFPTEIRGEIADGIRERGREYGRSTGRPRRIGWLDGKVLRDSCDLNGYDGLVVVGMNVLAEMPELKVCTHYDSSGRPVYKQMKPWPKIDSREVERNGIDAFPRDARDCLDLISELAGGAEIYMIAYDFGKELRLKDVF